ncbi:MAG: hypothetical protein ABI396_06075 [Ktedonobacteraceae bacterium]
MPSKSLTTEQVLTLLAETPPRIAALTAGLAPAQLQTTPNHDGWSANDVLAHLRACADVWGNCIVAMIRRTRRRCGLLIPAPGSRRRTILSWSFPYPDVSHSLTCLVES